MLDAYVVNVFDEVAGSELAVANAYRDRVVADGGANLLLYLPLDANYGLTDQSGNGRNGTAVGGVTIGAIAGPGDGLPFATDFDGVDDRVTTTYNPFTNATIRTYEGWAWRDDTLAAHNLISSDVPANAPFLQLSSGSQNVLWKPDNAIAGVTWAAAWPGSAQWVHWMLVFDEGGDTAKLYINGSLVSSQAATSAYNATPGNFAIGARGTNNFFNGRQAHVAVYNTDKSSLAATHAAAYPYAALSGNTSISVLDLTDFNLDPEGGSLKVDDGTNNETITYTAPAGSTGTLNLGTALTHNYLTGTKVTILVNGLPVVERWADLREPDGEELLRTLVPHQLRALMALGQRDEDASQAEHVAADFEGGDFVIQNVLALRPTGLELQASGSDPALSGEPIRWVERNSGAVVAYVVGIEDATTGKDEFYAVARSRDDQRNAEVFLRAESATGLSFAHVRCLVSPTTPDFIQIGLNGTFKTILQDDGTSDFEFATSGGWQNWTPATFGGWSVNPTGGIYRYKQFGKTVHLMIRQPNTGTSNATTKTIGLPVNAATITNAVWSAPAAITDNGVTLTTSGRGIINSAATTVTFATDWALGAFTAAGAASIRECQITYEAA